MTKEPMVGIMDCILLSTVKPITTNTRLTKDMRSEWKDETLHEHERLLSLCNRIDQFQRFCCFLFRLDALLI